MKVSNQFSQYNIRNEDVNSALGFIPDQNFNMKMMKVSRMVEDVSNKEGLRVIQLQKVRMGLIRILK